MPCLQDSVARRGAILPPLRSRHAARSGRAAADGSHRRVRGEQGHEGAGLPVQDRAGAGRRRDGDGLSRHGPQVPSERGGEGDAAGARLHDGGRSFPARSGDRCPAHASAHSFDVRIGRSRWVALLRHAVRRRRDAARPDSPRDAASGGGRAQDRARSLGSAGVCARARRHPPRHQARQHPAGRRARDGGRLRHCARAQQQRDGVVDPDRTGGGDAALHGARAGDGGARGGCSRRHLRRGRAALRDDRGRAAVHRSHGAGDRDPEHDGESALAHHVTHQPGAGRRPGGDEGAGQESRRPVPDSQGAGDRARSGARCELAAVPGRSLLPRAAVGFGSRSWYSSACSWCSGRPLPS